MGYWEKRQEEMYKAGEMTVNQYFTRLEKAFNQAKKELQKTIEAFYFRYAEENGISYAAAQRRLNAAELGDLKDFIALVMQNIGRYNQTVNNLSIKARITRYQALEAQVDAILRRLYAVDYEAMAEQTMAEAYREAYYRTWYNIDQYHGLHMDLAQIEPRTVETLLSYPFNGAAFSSRLWKQKDHLQTQLMESVTTMLIQGKHPKTLAADFAKKMQSKKFDAYRLLHTESSFLMSEAAHVAYREDDVKKYQILATLDSKTCGLCGDLDGKVYDVDKAVVGVNMPPFHPLCRCTDVPYYDDESVDMSRTARDSETGKTYDVPGNITYKEWHAQYIEQNPDKVLAEKKLRNKVADEAQFKKYRQVLGNDAPKDLDSFQKLKYTDGSGWKSLQRDYRDASYYEKIISDAGKLNIKGKPLRKIDRIDLTDYTFLESHINRTRKHGVTKGQAQAWVNDSIAAYSRWEGEVTVYISRRGAVVVNFKDKTISTAYGADEYDEKFIKLLEVLKND